MFRKTYRLTISGGQGKVTLPKLWIDRWQLKNGEKLEIHFSAEHPIIFICPEKYAGKIEFEPIDLEAKE